MRKKKKKKEEEKKKKITFIVANNVIASRPHERRPTGTPHARAKNHNNNINNNWILIYLGCDLIVISLVVGYYRVCHL